MKMKSLAAVLGVLMLALPAGAAAAGPAQIQQSQQSAVAYLRSQQLESGAFNGFGSEWALSALAAAKVAPAEVKASPTGTDARSYYRTKIGNPSTWPSSEAHVTDYENAALAAYAAGIDPARVSASQNLIARIVAGYDTATPGYYGEHGFLNGTVFALMALADTHTHNGTERVPTVLLEQSIEALRANQHTDGGWTYLTAAGDSEALAGPSEAETTGAAMAALCGAGVPSSNQTITAAEHFLASDLEAESSGNGAFATEFGPNTDSNAWAVEGLNACGLSAQSAELTTSQGKTPLDFLISQQLGGGGFGYEVGEASANLYSSQDALRALAGAGFTTTPAKTHAGMPKWVAQASFEAGVPAQVTLIVEGSQLHPCAVSFTPGGPTATLASVLAAAKISASPAGCVSSFAPESGKGAVTAIDGQTAAGGWQVSVDGGKPKAAKTTTKVKVGSTLALVP